MPIGWKNYLALRRITQKEYISALRISSYEELLSHIDKKDVIPPDLSEVSHEFESQKTTAKKTAKPETSAQKLDISKRKPKPRTTRRRATKSAPKSKT